MATQDPTGLSEPNSYYFRNGSNVLVPRSLADVRSDLGVGLTSQQIFYGSSTPGTTVNETITIPAWAKTYRFRIHGSGAGGSSGAVQPTTTTAVSGGSSGAAGFFLDVEGLVSGLTALGSNTINLSLGAPGAGGAASTTAAANVGQSGNDTTLTINSVVVARASRGAAPSNATTAGNNSNRQGGNAGLNGLNSGTGAGASGLFSNTFNVAGSGGSGAGIAASGGANAGGAGSRGATLERDPTEVIPSGGAISGGNGGDAVAVLVAGVPVPGNGPGGGASHVTGGGGRGGDGINGSSGGGGGSCRSGSSGRGGNGGRSFAIIEFFGSAANTIEVISSAPVNFGGRLTCVDNDPIGNNGSGTTLFYEPYLHLQYPSINGDTDQIINREFPSAGLSMDFTGLAANCYDLFLRYNRTTQQTELARVAWTNSTTRGYTPAKVQGLTVFATNTNSNKEYLLVGTVYWNGTQLRNQDRFRWISNLYNLVSQRLNAIESAATWSATTAAGVWEAWGNRSGAPTGGLNNRLEVVSCNGEPIANLSFIARLQAGSGGGAAVRMCLDSTNSNFIGTFVYTILNADVPYPQSCFHPVSIGLHFFQPVQTSVFNTTAVFASDNGCGVVGSYQC
jgi:hypothetical protein